MTAELGTQRLRATTVAVADPGPLERLLPAQRHCTAFIRRGEGIITIGELLRADVQDPSDADAWWRATAEHIDHDSELPGVFGTGPLAVGSFVFDPGHTRLGSVLVVPKIIVGRREDRTWATRVSVEGGCRASVPEPGDPTVTPVGLRLTRGGIDAGRWQQSVADAVDLIRDGDLEKVVLARDLTVEADEPIDLRHVLGHLIEDYPTTWTYLVDQMVGATPELLIRRQGGLATSRVLAGTVSLDPSQTDTVRRAAELARSAKDVTEHEFAVASVARALAPFCSAMNVPEAPSVLSLPNVLHLATDITGLTEQGASALALAAALHPSAAVCGTPTERAREVIREHEGMDRGRYAGPVGWVDARGDGEWVIALRGGRLEDGHPERMRIFAGAGIVADSEPEAEVAETAAKFVPMLQALGLA